MLHHNFLLRRVIDTPNVFHREVSIHLFSTPFGHAGLRMNVPLFELLLHPMDETFQMSRRFIARTTNGSARLVSENNVAALSLLARKSAFVNKPMIMPTTLVSKMSVGKGANS